MIDIPHLVAVTEENEPRDRTKLSVDGGLYDPSGEFENET